MLATLYKKNNSGSIQYWKISVYEDSDHSRAHVIETEYGQVGTPSPQTTFDTIYEGKNIGKANETSPKEQAEFEAKSKWQKQKKKGYVESIEAAEAEELDDVIEGGIVPMLAQSFAKHGHKIKYPCMVQRKYDGIRLIAIVKDGDVTLWSRSRKPIYSLPHIEREIKKLNLPDGTILDGEAYNQEFKDNFEHIVHLVRQDEADENCTDVEYHVYDLVSKGEFRYRYTALEAYLKKTEYLKLVPTYLVESEDQVMDFFDKFKNEGYEGAMLRNSDSLYVNKRSYDLQKVKEFDDAEFEITGIDEGRGKLAGHVGAFVCQTKDGKEFLAKMSGDTSRLKEYFDNHKLWKGKQLTVKFQGLTGANGVPRFPVGVAIRDYE